MLRESRRNGPAVENLLYPGNTCRMAEDNSLGVQQWMGEESSGRVPGALQAAGEIHLVDKRNDPGEWRPSFHNFVQEVGGHFRSDFCADLQVQKAGGEKG